MLFVWQLPLSDARLISPIGIRLPTPDWPTPRLTSDFVRGFGPVLRRRRGGHEEFLDEGVYAAAHRALRFGAGLTSHSLKLGDRTFMPRAVFRRLLCSDRQLGGVCARVEVGLDCTAMTKGEGPEPLAGRDWINLALQIAELPVGIHSVRRQGRIESTLWNCGPQIATAYLDATSPTAAIRVDPAERVFVSAGVPLVLVEYLPEECVSLPDGARAVAAERVGGLDLQFMWLEYRRRQFGLWFLRREARRDALIRRLRVGLLRLHAEHQALRAVLTLVLRGDLPYGRGTPHANLLDTYLQNAVRMLSRDQHGGFSHTALQEVIAAYQSVVDAEELKLLESRLNDVRRQIGSGVVSYAEAAAQPPQVAALPPPAREQGGAVQVFVSYSHRDAKYVKPGSLVDYLSGGLKNDKIDFWYDPDLRGGDLWDERIRMELDRSDIALVLVSQWFLNSHYVTDIEATKFIEAMRSRGLRVYPVILRKCDWKTRAWLARTQSQPRDDKTLEGNYRTQAAREELYLAILQELRGIAADLRTERAGASSSPQG